MTVNNMSTSSSENSSYFQSAVDEAISVSNVKMGGADDVFENSVCTEREDDGSTAQSSLCSSREDLDAAWAKLPKGAKDVCKLPSGILYIERYESFVRNNWPYDVRRGNLCHPRALALAGLQFLSMDPAPSAKCLLCLTVLEDLQANSNPWILHSETSPDCYIVKLGQRDEVDDYTMDQMMEMHFMHICHEADRKFKERENILKQQLFALREYEKTSNVTTMTNENH